MKLQFEYDLQKDIENYKIASRSINNKKPTKMQELYINEYGNIFEDDKLEAFTKKFIAEQNLDLDSERDRIQEAWQLIEEEFLKRVEKIFSLAAPAEIVKVFLTTDGRCSYNIERNYFFVSITRQSQNLTIMHELLHFWTWWRFHSEVESGRMTKECYNDVKESLTELLNVEFQDLLAGGHDSGYPQHKEMRSVIHETWIKTKDIAKTFEAASGLCPMNKPISSQ